MEVGSFFVDGVVVDFEVGGEEDDAVLGVDSHGHRFGDRVGYRNRLDFHGSGFVLLAGGDGGDIGVLDASAFFEAGAEEGFAERAGVDGGLDVGKEIGEGSDVILVGVGEEDAAEAVFVFDQVGEIGDDDVDAVLGFVGERYAAVDEDEVVSLFNDGAIFADFSSPTQRNNF